MYLTDCLDGKDLDLKVLPTKSSLFGNDLSGYPATYEIGYEITRSIDKGKRKKIIFVAEIHQGKVVTHGGRAPSTLATGDTYQEARKKVSRRTTLRFITCLLQKKTSVISKIFRNHPQAFRSYSSLQQFAKLAVG